MEKEKTIWKPIKGYENLYLISNQGQVKSLGRICTSKNGSTQRKRVRLLKGDITIHGYKRVTLFDENGITKKYAVHGLVAQAFIPNPKNKEEVNHINENKTDNRVSNLEWVTSSENCNYGTRNERISATHIRKGNYQAKPVIMFTLDGKELDYFNSSEEVQRKLGIGATNVSRVCRGIRNTAGGYKWRYAHE